MKKQLFTLIVSTLVLAATVAGTNRLVDPFGLWESGRIGGVNRSKTRFTDGTHMAKPHSLLRRRAHTLLLGSSRVGEGLNCTMFDTTSCYNAALPGGSLYEAGLMLAQSKGFARTVYLGLDFETALRGVDHPPGFSGDRFRYRVDGSTNWRYPLQSARDYFSLYLAVDTSLQSALTVWQQDPARAEIISRSLAEDGSWSVRERSPQQLAPEQARAFTAIRGFANAIVKGAMSQGPGVLDQRMDDYFTLLKQTIGMAEKAGIELQLFINPSHALFLDVLKKQGADKQLMEWLTRLQALDTHAQLKPIWLFIDYDSYSLSPAPDQLPNPWFNDPIHYNQALGAILIRRMRGGCAGEGPGYCLDRLDLDGYADRFAASTARR